VSVKDDSPIRTPTRRATDAPSATPSAELSTEPISLPEAARRLRVQWRQAHNFVLTGAIDGWLADKKWQVDPASVERKAKELETMRAAKESLRAARDAETRARLAIREARSA
jgi:hypothetical protein